MKAPTHIGSAYAQVARIADLIMTTVICLAVAGMALSVFTQVVARYLFHSPPFWTEELARYLLVWLTFIGAVAAHQAREHISVESFPDLFGGRCRAFLDLMISIVVVAVLVVILRAGIDVSKLGAQRSPALGLSMRYIYGALPVGAALMIIVTLIQMGRDVARLFTGAPRDVD